MRLCVATGCYVRRAAFRRMGIQYPHVYPHLWYRATCGRQRYIFRTIRRFEWRSALSITVSEYTCVSDHVTQLGCRMPTGIAMLPHNFETATSACDLLLRAEASTIQKLFRNQNVPLDSFHSPSERPPSVHNKHFDWAPILFVSAALLSENPAAVNVALGVIANYATDFFKGLPKKAVKLHVVVERKADRVCKKVTYEGDAAGLQSLPDLLRRISDE